MLSWEFEIPIYQRQYKWEREQIDNFLNDLMCSFEKDNEFWFGTILLSTHRPNTVLSIIDGQQRLLTMFLLFAIFLEEFPKEEIHRYKLEKELIIKTFVNDPFFQLSKSIQEFLSNPSVPNLVETALFSKLKNIFQNFKDKKFNSEQKSLEFKNYLKNKVHCSILLFNIDSYKYFENLNSKGIKLTLVEKCMAFLLSTNKKNLIKLKENIKLFTWLLSPHKEKKVKLTSEQFFETFILIFCVDKKSSNLFHKFVDTISERGVNDFLTFLKITKEISDNEDKKFSFAYFKNVCFVDYWKIYVMIKFCDSSENVDLNLFLETIWKFDLIRHLNGIAKKSIKQIVLEFLRDWKTKPITYSKYKNFLKKIMSKSPNYIENEENVKIFYDGDCKNIGLNTPDNFKSRLKTFMYLLYEKDSESETKSRFYNFHHSKNISYDHIVPISKKHFALSSLNNITNLCLIDKEFNSKLGTLDLQKKFSELLKHPNPSFLGGLISECNKDYEKTQFENKGKNQYEVFWDYRKKSIDKRIENIRDKYLTIYL